MPALQQRLFSPQLRLSEVRNGTFMRVVEDQDGRRNEASLDRRGVLRFIGSVSWRQA